MKKLHKCPVCGHESWLIVYGLMTPQVMQELPREAVFGGCTMLLEELIDPDTGETVLGTPEWQCQNEQRRHQW